MSTTRLRSLLALPLWILLSAGGAFADVNLFDWSNITIDSTFTSPAIGSFDASCAAYNLPCTGTQNFPPGFPLGNMFGEHVQTAEGDYDTIFNGASSDSGVYYDNVFFHMTNGLAVPHIGEIIVDGAQDGVTDTHRDFTSFLLISYPTDPHGPYTLLYQGAPTLTNGVEHLQANVNLDNVGPNFVIQFQSSTNSGARIFDVIALTPEPADFLAFLPFATICLVGVGQRWRQRRG